ncbi:MAG: T9SS type A sorting domain-containing protein [candidate division KSB1 bacterium]|nr:T9SS type A sorting domain-containing protein [candidate division KSB1 bacterium]
MKIKILFSLLFAVALQAALAQETSTWQTIQKRIFDTNCTVCHAAGTSFARQSDLILTENVAYGQLINVKPRNEAAAADGLLRVGTEGLASLYKSFLWEKINAPDQEHFYRDHPQYGAMMPLGLPPLTNGELEFIRRWIIARAPQTGEVVDRAVLNDTTRYQPPAFAPLRPPTNGVQLHLGPFAVAPHYERELFSYVPLNNPTDLFIERVEIIMRPASHHFILYGFREGTPTSLIPPPNTIRDLRDPNGNYIYTTLLTMQYHKFVAGTQWPLLNYHAPPGVALRLPANSGLDMNSHYANRSNATIQGEVYANLYFADPTKVKHIAEILTLSNQDINLPPKTVTTLTKTFTFSTRMHVFLLFSHAHEHMVQFNVEIVGGPRDGELIYVAYDWEHPPILRLDPPLVLEPGQGLKLVVTYNNWTNKTLRFGLLSEDEMMILFGYYYTSEPTAVESDVAAELPQRFALEQNYPNPFNPATSIQYSVGTNQFVSLKVYDVLGKEVATLVNAQQRPGIYRVRFESLDLPSGIYFYQLSAGNFVETRKMLLAR